MGQAALLGPLQYARSRAALVQAALKGPSSCAHVVGSSLTAPYRIISAVVIRHSINFHGSHVSLIAAMPCTLPVALSSTGLAAASACKKDIIVHGRSCRHATASCSWHREKVVEFAARAHANHCSLLQAYILPSLEKLTLPRPSLSSHDNSSPVLVLYLLCCPRS